MKIKNIVLAADHGGFALKQQLIPWLKEQGFSVEDLGADTLDMADDYPPFAQVLAKKIGSSSKSLEENPKTIGILLCRTGAGMAIVANRFSGVRAVVCRDSEEARAARTDNNANILVLSADDTDFSTAQEIFQVFSTTEFAGGRHLRRLEEFS